MIRNPCRHCRCSDARGSRRRPWALRVAAGLALGFAAAPLGFAARLDAIGFETGETLAAWCAPPTTTLAPDLCSAYVVGVVDALEASGRLDGAVCLPPGLRLEAVASAVRTYIAAHAEERRFSAASTVAASLTAAYPCGRP